jgi:hypothetical protein
VKKDLTDTDFEERMINPVTGDNPGFEYVKPSADANPKITVVLYQLRDGLRATDLRVGFGDGHLSEMSNVVRQTKFDSSERNDRKVRSGHEISNPPQDYILAVNRRVRWLRI